jgi:hypothetical protein
MFATQPYRSFGDDHRKPLARYGAIWGARAGDLLPLHHAQGHDPVERQRCPVHKTFGPPKTAGQRSDRGTHVATERSDCPFWPSTAVSARRRGPENLQAISRRAHRIRRRRLAAFLSVRPWSGFRPAFSPARALFGCQSESMKLKRERSQQFSFNHGVEGSSPSALTIQAL